MTTRIFIFILISFASQILFANSCEFKKWSSYKKVDLLSHPSKKAYIFKTSHKAIDADGAPNAYHPNKSALDYLENAGYPNTSWWKSVLVADPNNSTKAYIQKDGKYKGYFVSKTSLQNNDKKVIDPSRYIDATKIPYLVFPKSFYNKKGTGLLGDHGYAINLSNGKESTFIVADIGPTNAKLGEISIALAEALGGENPNPKNGRGVPTGEILYILFPYSVRKNNNIGNLLESIGGIEALNKCK